MIGKGKTVQEISKALGWSAQKVRALCLKYEKKGCYQRKGKRGKEDLWFVTKQGVGRLNKIIQKRRN